MPPPLQLSGLAGRTPEQPISHFMKLALENPGLISLAAGFVDFKVCSVDATWSGLAFKRPKR